MPLFRKPEPELIRRFLASQSEFEFTYDAIGATSGDPPAGYVVDHTRARIGSGAKDFEIARSALENWRQFGLGWVGAWPADTPIRQGQVLAVVARSLGFWWLNACRIVYLVNEDLDTKRFGFAYGTLPRHVGSGEERFLVEMDQEGTVWYDILAFSRPHGLLARLGYPYMRRMQRRFAKESVAAMQATVQSVAEVRATR